MSHVEQLWQSQKAHETTSIRLVEDPSPSESRPSEWHFADFFSSEKPMGFGLFAPGVEELPKCHRHTSY